MWVVCNGSDLFIVFLEQCQQSKRYIGCQRGIREGSKGRRSFTNNEGKILLVYTAHIQHFYSEFCETRKIQP